MLSVLCQEIERSLREYALPFLSLVDRQQSSKLAFYHGARREYGIVCASGNTSRTKMFSKPFEVSAGDVVQACANFPIAGRLLTKHRVPNFWFVLDFYCSGRPGRSLY